MENILTFLSAHPAYILLAAVVVIFLVFSILKKIVKLIIIATVLFIGYLAYVKYAADDVQMLKEKAKELVP